MKPEDILLKKWEYSGLLKCKKSKEKKLILASKLEEDFNKFFKDGNYENFQQNIEKLKEDGWFKEE